MPSFDIGEYKITDSSDINIILGKNGSGKSVLLRTLANDAGKIAPRSKYISPERGGAMRYSAGMEEQITGNRTHHLRDQRAKNQMTEFRTQSAALFGEMISNFMQALHDNPKYRADEKHTFENLILSRINRLLDNVYVERVTTGRRFVIRKKSNKSEVDPQAISSGESELFSLATELLSFVYEDEKQAGVIFFDEPDVHIHPDLQYRLAELIVDLAKTNKITFFIATHSTAIVSALSESKNSHVFFMKYGDTKIAFEPISDAIQEIVPVFSPHPLSNQFNAKPLLLVEGLDDVLIWTQASRSSNGKIKITPCATHTISQMAKYEAVADRIGASIYDKPIFYSIRDRDDGNGKNTNLKNGVSMVLGCYSTENLLLSDEVLKANNSDWDTMMKSIAEWTEKYPSHQYHGEIKKFIDSKFNRKGFRVKNFRNILLGLLTSDRPFYFVIGQAIGQVNAGDLGRLNTDGSLLNFLGKEVVENIVLSKT